MKRLGLIAGLALITAFAVAVPASACSIVQARCDPDGCHGPRYLEAKRERDQRVAIEYGRAMAQAMNARVDSPALDRGYDLARILLPNMVRPVALNDDGCFGPFADDEDGSGHDSIEEAEATIRREDGSASHVPLNADRLTAFAARRIACNTEVRRDLASYLNSALPPDQIHELWEFLLPRAGAHVPADAAQPVAGARLLYFGADGALVLPTDAEGRESHIDSRRERAWQYLANHRNGRAIMSALNQFVAARIANGRTEAQLCPATMAQRGG